MRALPSATHPAGGRQLARHSGGQRAGPDLVARGVAPPGGAARGCAAGRGRGGAGVAGKGSSRGQVRSPREAPARAGGQAERRASRGRQALHGKRLLPPPAASASCLGLLPRPPACPRAPRRPHPAREEGQDSAPVHAELLNLCASASSRRPHPAQEEGQAGAGGQRRGVRRLLLHACIAGHAGGCLGSPL